MAFFLFQHTVNSQICNCWMTFIFVFCYLLYLLSKWKEKNTLRENISLFIILLMTFFQWKDKIARHYSICYKNYCSKGITDSFGYVKVHKIVSLLVPDMLTYNFFLGCHVLKANMTTLNVYIIRQFQWPNIQ